MGKSGLIILSKTAAMVCAPLQNEHVCKMPYYRSLHCVLGVQTHAVFLPLNCKKIRANICFEHWLCIEVLMFLLMMDYIT
jgi:hypothetical protein